MTATLEIGMSINRNSSWLGAELVSRANQAQSAFEGRNYTETVAQTAQCLERLLKRMLAEWQIPVSGLPALGPLIGAVDKSGKAPEQLVDRLNQANRIRNIVLHDKPFPKICVATQGDALLILNILAMVAEWYRENYGPGGDGDIKDALPVFLSVGGPHRLDQEQFLSLVRVEMRAACVQLLTVEGGEYSRDKPFEQVAQVMTTCRAALVIGLERSHAYTVFERELSERQKLHQDQYIPTAWNQIEGSIATALRLPVLVLRERRLHREGIFEAENHGHRIREFDLALESKGLSQDLRDFLSGWVQHIRAAPPPQPRAS
jgi:hypothetical protein